MLPITICKTKALHAKKLRDVHPGDILYQPLTFYYKMNRQFSEKNYCSLTLKNKTIQQSGQLLTLTHNSMSFAQLDKISSQESFVQSRATPSRPNLTVFILIQNGNSKQVRFVSCLFRDFYSVFPQTCLSKSASGEKKIKGQNSTKQREEKVKHRILF